MWSSLPFFLLPSRFISMTLKILSADLSLIFHMYPISSLTYAWSVNSVSHHWMGEWRNKGSHLQRLARKTPHCGNKNEHMVPKGCVCERAREYKGLYKEKNPPTSECGEISWSSDHNTLEWPWQAVWEPWTWVGLGKGRQKEWGCEFHREKPGLSKWSISEDCRLVKAAPGAVGYRLSCPTAVGP